MAHLPKAICELHAELLKLEFRIISTISDFEIKIEKVVKSIISIIWGIVSVTGEDLLSAVISTATNIAKSILNSVSSLASSILTSILTPLLMLLIDSSNTIYSLTFIPHNQALLDSEKERDLLDLIDVNVNIIMSIVNKWVNNTTPENYYKIMSEAAVHTNNALRYLNKVSEGLSNEINSSFNYNEYDKGVAELQIAIDTLDTSTVTGNILNPENTIDAKRDIIYAGKAAKISTKYTSLRNAEKNIYQKNLVNLSFGKTGAIAPTAAKAAKAKYTIALTGINNNEKAELIKANTESYAEAVSNHLTKDISGIFKDAADEFASDINLLRATMNKLFIEVKKAYTYNKSSQMLVNSLVNFRGNINNLITFLLKLVRDIGNGTGKTANIIINNGIDYVEVADDILNDAVKEYSVGDKSRTGFKSVGDISLARASLIGADMMFGATINKELIDIINRDDAMIEDSEKYNKFINKLHKIIDWNGVINTWASKPLSSGINPYILLIKDIASSLAIVSTLPIPSKNGEARTKRLKTVISNVDKNVTKLKNHNSQVINTLKTWTPPQSDHVASLAKILSSINMLATFAYSLSLPSVITSIITSFGDLNLDWEKCDEAFPELYKDPDIIKMMKTKEMEPISMLNLDESNLNNQMSTLSGKLIDYDEATKNFNNASTEDLRTLFT